MNKLFHLRTVILCLVFGPVHAEENGPSRKIPRAVFCQSLLGAVHATGRANNPVPTLQSLVALLEKRSPAGPSEDLYADVTYTTDLAQKMDGPMERRYYAEALARLKRLKRDTSGVLRSPQYVNYEFRGAKDVAQVLAAYATLVNQLEPAVQTELRRRYPVLRLNNLKTHAITVLAAGLGIGLGETYHTRLSLAIAVATVAASSAWEYVNLAILPNSGREIHANKQYELIRAALAKRTSGFPLSLVSGQFVAEEAFHHNVMIVGAPPDIDLTANASESAIKGVLDEPLQIPAAKGMTNKKNSKELIPVTAVEGEPHHWQTIYYDSLFFVDTDTQEPVWMIYYRASGQRRAEAIKIPPAPLLDLSPEPGAPVSSVRLEQ